MIFNNSFSDIFKELEKKYADQRKPIVIPPPPPPLQPQADREITSELSSRHGIEKVPISLRQLAEAGHNTLCPGNMSRVSIGAATCGRAAGAQNLLNTLSKRTDFERTAIVAETGCIGACYAEPLADVRTPEGLHYLFGKIESRSLWSIINTANNKKSHSRTGLWAIFKERQIGIFTGFEDLELLEAVNDGIGNFIGSQVRRITGNCGLINPNSIAEYIATGGYFGLARVLQQWSPAQVRAEISAAGLRGRGGGGFKTADKMEIAASSCDPVRIIIANADEGDPGAYMDRALLESDPHRVLEGIILAAYAVGAHQAHIFVRSEYPLAIARLRQAIDEAYKWGILGERVLESNFSLQIGLTQSAGAFVGGEETALLKIMQGGRGEPKKRPPYPAQQGLNAHPTVVNNVETLANITWIIANGAQAFREIGTSDSPGTKIFCLTGDIKRTGFIEVPLGITSKEIVEKIGGAASSAIKAIQIGGPSGGILPYTSFAMDYGTVASAGAMIGSGGLVILDKTRCLVDLARHLVGFMAEESCGQCLLCRDGLMELEKLLLDLTSNRGYPNIIDEIESISLSIAETSLCGLGHSSVNPMLTTLKYFPEEYSAHLEGRCPAVSCKAMINFEIIQSRCKECHCCYLVCPSGAVLIRTGKERYFVDNEKCSRCWACAETCPFGCILPTSGGEYMWNPMFK